LLRRNRSGAEAALPAGSALGGLGRALPPSPSSVSPLRHHTTGRDQEPRPQLLGKTNMVSKAALANVPC